MNNLKINICLTLDVSKLDKFNEFNDEHPKNIKFILLIFEVLKLSIFKFIKFEQP